jgi:hypothetical protein
MLDIPYFIVVFQLDYDACKVLNKEVKLIVLSIEKLSAPKKNYLVYDHEFYAIIQVVSAHSPNHIGGMSYPYTQSRHSNHLRSGLWNLLVQSIHILSIPRSEILSLQMNTLPNGKNMRLQRTLLSIL